MAKRSLVDQYDSNVAVLSEKAEAVSERRAPDSIPLPVLPRVILDNSVVDCHSRCARLAFYQYWLNRSPAGKNYPIEFGLVYHNFREQVELIWQAEDRPLEESHLRRIGELAATIATKDWEDPPIGHKKDWMTYDRIMATCELAIERWIQEKITGSIKVLYTEQPFEVELPFRIVHLVPIFDENGVVVGYDEVDTESFGGRIDQIIEWNNRIWIRDFKTTSRMGSTFALKFDPNNQFTGYTWAGSELSGDQLEGAIVEVPYNTKTKGPEIHQFISTRSPGHITQWLSSMEQEIREIRRREAATLAMGGDPNRMLLWPMRTSACDDYGGCYFRRACQNEHPIQIERWLASNTIESVWDFTNPDGEEGVPE